MTPEKTAVLVVTGVVAVLLALTLARSRPEDETIEHALPAEEVKQAPIQDDSSHFVRILDHLDPAPIDVVAPGPEHGPVIPRPRRSSWRIRKGDSFEKIAKAVYGRRSMARLLVDANPSHDPRRLQIGALIVVPDAGGKAVRDGDRKNRSESKRSRRWHLVRHGERLETIALAHYGRSNQWKRIFDANREVLRSPHRIREGMRLRLP